MRLGSDISGVVYLPKTGHFDAVGNSWEFVEAFHLCLESTCGSTYIKNVLKTEGSRSLEGNGCSG